MTVHPLGKHATRYRSHGSYGGKGHSELRHERVFTRKSIIEELLTGEVANIETILREKAIGCMVTIEEHRALTAYDRSLDGWSRHEAAGVRVRDTFTASEFNAQP